jgi:hypothetical protein
MKRSNIQLDDILFPGVLCENWQMMPWERIAITGTLARLRPSVALEIGVYFGGSLSLTSQFAKKVIAIDIDPEVPNRFCAPTNAEIRVGASSALIPQALNDIRASGEPLHFVLIDADHSSNGIRRDIELVLQYVPHEPMIILMHDSGNPDCRTGILTADWAANEHVHFVDCDFVPGQIIEHSVIDGHGEVWGGFALAYLNGAKRNGPPILTEGAKTSINRLHTVMNFGRASN